MTGAEGVVALVALPGGIGVLREVMQGLENAVYHDGAPVVVVKAAPYMDSVRAAFEGAIAEGFIKEHKRGVLKEWSPGQDLRAVIFDEKIAAPSIDAAPRPI